MNELHDILKPTWGAEQWILEGWEQISTEEKTLIKARIDTLFKDGLPFELQHDKMLYVYTFSLLAQLEVLAIQIPLKFKSTLTSPLFKEQMHTQLLDEIFHGLVFTKIVYLLCAPHALPPTYNESIEKMCDFIRNEECPKVGIVLLNLIGEGWIEEIFSSLQRQHIAPQVFATILEDEHRHVCEADLYRELGLPEQDMIRAKIEYLEEHLLTNIFLQYKYISSVTTLLGTQGMIDFIQALNKKHTQQLKKIKMKPSQQWHAFIHMTQLVFPVLQNYSKGNHLIEMTPMRQVLMTQWGNPSDPTMVGEFNINVSCLDFFNKKYPSETLTTLMLQAISQGLADNSAFRLFLSHNELYQSDDAYVAIVVKLPGCGDHISSIVFKNCHTLSVPELSSNIRKQINSLVYCYKKREELEQTYPHLKEIVKSTVYEMTNDAYPYLIPGNAFVALSNIGFCGYTQTKSPLRSNEALKYTLLEIEKKQVWNHSNQCFEAQDILPVSISADHRVFDGNIPVPKLVAQLFNQAFQRMEQSHAKPIQQHNKESIIITIVNQLLINNLEMGYKTLVMLQTVWPDFMDQA